MSRLDFDRLYAEHAQDLFAFLAYRVGDRELARDLVADSFERAIRAQRRFDSRRAGEKTWLYAIALNLVRDHARRAGVERRALERMEGDERLVAPDEGHAERLAVREELRAGLQRLSDEEREAVALRFGGGLSIPEIARLLGEPETTVDGRVRRGLRKLRAALDEVG